MSMRPLQIDAAVVAVLALVAYLTGHSSAAIFLGWFVFPLIVLADFVGEKRKNPPKQ